MALVLINMRPVSPPIAGWLTACLPRRLLQATMLLLASALLPAAALAASGNIAVIYPDLGEPYRSVFAQIIEGIHDRAPGRVQPYALGPNADSAELNGALRRKDARVVIALGRQGAKLAATLDNSYRIVVGGVLTCSESRARNLQVNLLAPDPALLFARIRELMPKVRRIYTVYDPRLNAWMMHQAKEAARAQEIELVAIEAQDLRGALAAYGKIFADSDSSRNALWLPQDAVSAEEGTVLPMVLQESWNRNLAVFSSNPNHVRQGVLFSLYPDNTGLGRHLAEAALALLDNDSADLPATLPLKNVLMSVNLRTAKHLGLNIGRAQHFDMVYPER